METVTDFILGGSKISADGDCSHEIKRHLLGPAAHAGAAEGKGAPHPGRGRPSLWLPEPLRPGKAQNTGATESAVLWSTRKLEQHATQGPLHIEQPGA